MIKLLDLADGKATLFGNRQGRQVFNKLQKFIDTSPTVDRFEISLKGIKATDASFPRESVISLAKQLRGEKYFFITNFANEDLIDNWDYAAKAKNQNVVIIDDEHPSVIGPDLVSAAKDLVDYVFDKEMVSTATVARELSISVQNASTRLKKLMDIGLIVRTEESAITGGKEFIYSAINKTA